MLVHLKAELKTVQKLRWNNNQNRCVHFLFLCKSSSPAVVEVAASSNTGYFHTLNYQFSPTNNQTCNASIKSTMQKTTFWVCVSRRPPSVHPSTFQWSTRCPSHEVSQQQSERWTVRLSAWFPSFQLQLTRLYEPHRCTAIKASAHITA